MEIPPRKKEVYPVTGVDFNRRRFFFFTTRIRQVVLPNLCCRLAISRRESRTGHMLRMQELLTIHLAIPPTSLVCSTKCNKSQNTWCDVGTQGEEAITWVAWVLKNEDTDSDDYILSSSFRRLHFFSMRMKLSTDSSKTVNVTVIHMVQWSFLQQSVSFMLQQPTENFC